MQHAARLRRPTKPRAHIILCYAPVLALSLLRFFAFDCIANPLRAIARCHARGGGGLGALSRLTVVSAGIT